MESVSKRTTLAKVGEVIAGVVATEETLRRQAQTPGLNLLYDESTKELVLVHLFFGEVAADVFTIGEPHFVDSEDCMGNKMQFWRVFAAHPDGVFGGVGSIEGFGSTKEAAIADCKANLARTNPKYVSDARNVHLRHEDDPKKTVRSSNMFNNVPLQEGSIIKGGQNPPLPPDSPRPPHPGGSGTRG